VLIGSFYTIKHLKFGPNPKIMEDAEPNLDPVEDSSNLMPELEGLMKEAWLHYQERLSSKGQHKKEDLEDGNGPKRTFTRGIDEWESVHYTIESEYLDEPLGFEVQKDEGSYVAEGEGVVDADMYVFQIDSGKGERKFYNMIDSLETITDPDFVRSSDDTIAFYFES